MATLAKALEVLRSQLNDAFPGRSIASDGWIGDAAHAGRASDHNPNKEGVVTAIDVTHDPSKFDAHRFAREVLAKNADERIEYIISNGKIWSKAKGWRQYTGSNPHDHHIHVSVHNQKALYDSNRKWDLGPAASDFRVIVKGKEIAGAKKIDGVSYAPVRALCEAAGLTVDFDAASNTATVR